MESSELGIGWQVPIFSRVHRAFSFSHPSCESPHFPPCKEKAVGREAAPEAGHGLYDRDSTVI